MIERKLDIFRVLSEIDKKNVEFYSTLPQEEQKGFLPIIVVRWLSGTFSKLQVILINELVNPFVFSLYKHPELIYKLMTVCTNGKQQRYAWNKTLSKKSTHPTATKIIQEYFHYNSRDANDAINILNPEDIISMAEEMGWQDDDINKMRKELGIKLIKTNKKTIKSSDILEL